jgi:quercetin dioxygenase-like cupin family protein
MGGVVLSTAVGIVSEYELLPFDESDPDDFRPDSRWALLVDPNDQGRSHVHDVTVIAEEIAPGDRIPLHEHPTSEVIIVVDGSPEVTVDNERRVVGPGTVVFIPARTTHGTRNASNTPVRLYAVFPTEQIGIRYFERNPAPGTEDDEPQPEFTIDARGIAAGGR